MFTQSSSTDHTEKPRSCDDDREPQDRPRTIQTEQPRDPDADDRYTEKNQSDHTDECRTVEIKTVEKGNDGHADIAPTENHPAHESDTEIDPA